MGSIWSRFRKKKSTIEILEQLEQDITKLEQFRRKNQERQKRFIAQLLLYSILFYILTALVFYFYYFPDRWKERLLYSIPLLLFPLVIWLVKKILHWYFVKRISGNDLALEDLKEKRKQILEDVMEKETYKKAKEILEKFDPARFKELEPPKVITPAKTPGTELRQRQFTQRSPPGSQLRPGMTPAPGAMTPARPQQGHIRPGVTPFGPRTAGMGIQPRNLMNASQNNTTPGPPLPRPVLPRERGKMDRLLEYLVGDGPQNRYALICRNCVSHNGMAMKEEFEFVAFRCCYCYAMNPARKKRPFAPRIEPVIPAKPTQSDSQDDNDEDSEEEGSSEEEGEEPTQEGGVTAAGGVSSTDDHTHIEKGVESDGERGGANQNTGEEEMEIDNLNNEKVQAQIQGESDSDSGFVRVAKQPNSDDTEAEFKSHSFRATQE